MQINRRLAVIGISLLGVGGLGTGVALAQSKTTPAPPASTARAPAQDTTELPGQEAPAAAENAPEKVEPGDANLPGGGHADAPGQSVDHQFQGVE